MAGILSTLRKQRLYLLIFCFFLWMSSAGVLFPHITPISVDYFAAPTVGDGVYVTCDDNVPGPAQTQGHNSTAAARQEACRNGSRTAVAWVAGTAFFQNGLAFLVSPLVGWASDGFGRKPFFAASQVFALVPSVWIGLYLQFGGAIFRQLFPALQPFVVFSAVACMLVVTRKLKAGRGNTTVNCKYQSSHTDICGMRSMPGLHAIW